MELAWLAARRLATAQGTLDEAAPPALVQAAPRVWMTPPARPRRLISRCASCAHVRVHLPRLAGVTWTFYCAGCGAAQPPDRAERAAGTTGEAGQ